jgi:hypothetical protein
MKTWNELHQPFSKSWRVAWVVLLYFALLPRVWAQGTAFTYSGILSDTGNPASGIYDLTFSLSTSSNSLAQVGSTLTDLDVPITNGLFTVALDFGSGIFTGNPLWLEIGVRTNGSANFTALNPLQSVTAVPYAIMAGSASNLLGMLPASQLSGAISPAQLPGTVLTNTETGVMLSGTFSGSGSGLNGLNPANLGAGTAGISISGNAATAITAANVTGNISDSQLSANIARLNGTNAFSGTNTFSGVTLATNGNNLINGAFTGNGGGLTNYQVINLTYSVSTNPPATAAGTNFSLDFSYTKVIWNLTTNAFISNTLHATSGDNHLEVWIQSKSTFTMSWLPNVNLVGTFTTNGLPITPSQGYWVMAVSQYGTNWNTNTCTYAIVPPNR